jgi:uncharacterized protein (DUF2235 family)
MKRIIICCDGTWNTLKKMKDGKLCLTNVVKIKDAIEPKDKNDILQIPYYDEGIGTSGSKLKQIFDGATGTGISENILEAYKFLIMNYEIGDELFFFGFSRGAFTVRSLVGLVRNSGILQRDSISMVDKAYKLYKSRDLPTHPRAIEPTLFRKTFAVHDKVPVKFIGVWDTVGALGNPLFINNIFSTLSISVMVNSFHDTELSSIVENAFQALAVDEKRRNFKATIWQQQASSTKQLIEQVWFVGVHSNIGGGYLSTELSDIALDWMVNKAKSLGLGLGVITSPGPDAYKAAVENSRKWFYRLIPKYYRPIGRIKSGNESLHDSVIMRLKNGSNYRPKNLNYFFP